MTASAATLTPVVMLDLAVIIAAGRALEVAAVRCGQPAVIEEIIAGIVLGPSLLGVLPGRLFPAEVRPCLGVLASVGVVLLIFGVGYEMEFSNVLGMGRTAAWVAFGSVLVPFALSPAMGTPTGLSGHHPDAARRH